MSRITPAYKQKGSAPDPRSYFPIAVLLTVALVFEQVIHSQLYNHILPFIQSTQFSFIKGTGAQDCGTAIALTATQILENQEECRIVSLDIHGAFDSVWWSGLLCHLKSIGLRGKAKQTLIETLKQTMICIGLSLLNVFYCVSLKRDTDRHPPLFMAFLPIEEVESLKNWVSTLTGS